LSNKISTPYLQTKS